MASKNEKASSREAKPRVTSAQRKMRRQQLFMAVVGIILILSMVLATLIR
jgi:predicted nucleic acid-binding Zn ribbon protein